MKNRRLFVTGLIAVVFALIIFFGVRQIAPQSNDPVEVMRIAGQAAGAVCGLGLAMILVAFFIPPRARRR